MHDRTETAGLQDYPLARRGVLMTGLISGFTLATQRVEAQAIHTGNRRPRYRRGADPHQRRQAAGLFRQAGAQGHLPGGPGERGDLGVHEYIKEVCRRLAKAGYFAVATEYYARIGDLSKMTDVQQIVHDVISQTPDGQYMADMDATAAWALDNGGSATRVGVLGFCRGGRQTWLYAAHSPHLKAAVAFYGPLGGAPSPIQPVPALDVADKLKCPLLGLYGGQDASIPVDLVRQAEAKAKAAHEIVEIVIYPDAPHGFHADYRPSYRQADAEDAWKRTLGWFRRFGVTPAG